MKIAIHHLNRSGSKLLHNNFQSYLKATGMPILCPDKLESIGQPLDFTDHEYATYKTNRTFTIMDNQLVYHDMDHFTNLRDERNSRISKLEKTDWGFVFKHTPWTKDKLLAGKIFDKDVAIIRKDMFDQTLSFCIARQTNIWGHGPKLDNLKSQREKIIIDPKIWSNFYNLLSYYNLIPWPEYVQVVNFEEMVKIKTCYEFCEFLNLEPLNFDFTEFEIELGQDKYDLVANLDDFKSYR